MTEKPNTGGIDKTAQRNQQRTLKNPSEFGFKCVCLEPRSILNKMKLINHYNIIY